MNISEIKKLPKVKNLYFKEGGSGFDYPLYIELEDSRFLLIHKNLKSGLFYTEEIEQ